MPVSLFRSLFQIYLITAVLLISSFASAHTLIHLTKSNCLSSLLYGLESVRLSNTDVHNFCFPFNAYVKMLHVNELAINKLVPILFWPIEQTTD